MSSGATGGADALQHYYCHQCERTVTLSPSAATAAADEVACPICHGGFIEEVDPPPPSPNPSTSSFFPFSSVATDPFYLSPSPFPFVLSSSSTSFDLRNANDLAGLFSADRSPVAPASAHSPGPVPFNPMLFLQDYIQQLISGGANIQIVVEGGPVGGLGGNLGDYFIGPGLEQLIQQLAENDPNRYGTPPAAKSAVASLPDIKISTELLASDEAQCAVCKDTFEMGDEAKQMPCKHIYHKDCILPWLELHNSCPVCRCELPTDDEDYEQRKGGTAAPAARTVVGAGDPGGAGGPATGASAVGSSASPRTIERRFRISFPWSSRISSQAEGSNAGGNDSNTGGDTFDASSGQQGDGRSGTRQEDLD